MTGPHDPRDVALARAFRYLESRDRSRREVELRLRRYGYEEELIAAVVDRLEELGYVDDGRFALAYAVTKGRSGWGARRIRTGLAAAGVSPAVIGESLQAAAVEAGSEGVAAADDTLVALVRRRFDREWQRDPEGATRRAAAFLQRRGHDWQTVRRVLRRAFEDPEEQGFR